MWKHLFKVYSVALLYLFMKHLISFLFLGSILKQGTIQLARHNFLAMSLFHWPLLVILLLGVVFHSVLSQSEGGVKGALIFQEEFDTLNTSRWQHLITGWRGGNNEFQYYTNRTENRYLLMHFCK